MSDVEYSSRFEAEIRRRSAYDYTIHRTTKSRCFEVSTGMSKNSGNSRVPTWLVRHGLPQRPTAVIMYSRNQPRPAEKLLLHRFCASSNLDIRWANRMQHVKSPGCHHGLQGYWWATIKRLSRQSDESQLPSRGAEL